MRSSTLVSVTVTGSLCTNTPAGTPSVVQCVAGRVCGHGGQRGGAAAGGRALDQPSSVIS